MTLEEGLVAHLRAATGVGSAVANGTSPQTYRIHPEVLPQKAPLPAIRYARVSTTRGDTLGGPTDLTTVRFQIDVWHTTHDGARTLGDAVRAALDDLRGNLGGATIQQALVESWFHQSEIDGDQEEHRITVDLIVRGYKET